MDGPNDHVSFSELVTKW